MGERSVLGRPIGSWVTFWYGLLPALTSKPQFIPASLFSESYYLMVTQTRKANIARSLSFTWCSLHQELVFFWNYLITSFHPHNTPLKPILLLPPFYNKNWPIDGQDNCPRGQSHDCPWRSCSEIMLFATTLCWPWDPVLISCQMVDLQGLPFTGHRSLGILANTGH